MKTCVITLVGISAALADMTTSSLRVAFVRHAESQNNVVEAISWEAYRKGRSSDPNLSERGYTQAAALGSWFGEKRFHFLLGTTSIDEFWVSPLKRTLLTMKPLADALAVKPQIKLNLFEAGGVYDSNHDYTAFQGRGGLTRSEMASLVPSFVIPETVNGDGWYTKDGRETNDECRTRAKDVARELVAKSQGLDSRKTLLVVAHYDFICAVLDALLHPDTTGPFDRWRHYNTAITVIDIAPPHDPTYSSSSSSDESRGSSGDRLPRVSFVAQNSIPHLLATGRDELVSGFPI